MSASPDDPVTRDWMGEADPAERPDPIKSARGLSRTALPKRFYTAVGLAEEEGGFRLTLDGRPANTPARKPLRLPTRALAERITQEWEQQVDVIDPARMPMTRLVNSAIDGVAERADAVVEDLGAYAGTDLVAYRAADPKRLVAAQAEAWDPILAWAHETFGARLILSEGVMHVVQPEISVAALRAAVAEVEPPFRLAALHAMTTLTGSLLIALAVLHGRLDAEAGFAAAHVDESHQASVWGSDAEAEQRLANRRAEFTAAAEVARLAV